MSAKIRAIIEYAIINNLDPASEIYDFLREKDSFVTRQEAKIIKESIMAKTRWDIRTEAALLIGHKTILNYDERVQIQSALREKFPDVQISTIRCAVGYIVMRNRSIQIQESKNK